LDDDDDDAAQTESTANVLEALSSVRTYSSSPVALHGGRLGLDFMAEINVWGDSKSALNIRKGKKIVIIGINGQSTTDLFCDALRFKEWALVDGAPNLLSLGELCSTNVVKWDQSKWEFTAIAAPGTEQDDLTFHLDQKMAVPARKKAIEVIGCHQQRATIHKTRSFSGSAS
jgi:hypothetical protein